VVIASEDQVDLGISPHTMEVVREGLRGRQESGDRRQGAGAAASPWQQDRHCQTSRGKNHGWVRGFCAYEDAKVAIVVFDEFGGKEVITPPRRPARS